MIKPKNNKNLINPKIPKIDHEMLAFVEALVKSEAPLAIVEDMTNHFLKVSKALSQKDEDVKRMLDNKTDNEIKIGYLFSVSIVCQQKAAKLLLEKPDHDKN